MNILFSAADCPLSPIAYIEKAFRRAHTIVKSTPPLPTPDACIKTWRVPIEEVQHYFTPPDIVLTEHENYLPSVIKALPWIPDVFLFVDTHVWYMIAGMERVPVLKAFWIIDMHTDPGVYQSMAKHYDVLFVTDRAYSEYFKSKGYSNVYWVPLACDPETNAKKISREKIYDIAFIGNQKHGRNEFIERLSKHFRVVWPRAFYEAATTVYEQSKFVLHISPTEGSILSARIFEGMAAGTALLADRADPITGMDEIFESGKHYIMYSDIEDLIEKVRYYLDHEDEREQIAKNGMHEVLMNHTYDLRVRYITDILEQFLTERLHPESADITVIPKKCVLPADILSSLMEDHQFPEALAYCMECKKMAPSHPEAYFAMGNVYLIMKVYEQAKICYQKAIDIDDTYAPAINGMGNLYKAMEQYEISIVFYKKALDLMPDNSIVTYNLALAYHLQHMEGDAVFFYGKTLTLDPANSDAYNNLYTLLSPIDYAATKGHAESLEKLHYLRTFLPANLRFENVKGYLQRAFEYM